MNRPRSVLTLILALVAFVALAAFAALAVPQGAAAAAKRAPLFSHPVHRGSSGKQVRAFKWIAAGHKPSVYGKIHFHLPNTKECGRECAKVILGIRWQLGEPVAYTKWCPDRTGKQATFGRRLYLILTGQKPRPVCWIGRAAQRLKVIATQRAGRAPPCAQRVVVAAKHELALGVQEQPPGSHSNTGTRVRYYQRHTVLGRQGFTGFPWCVAFAQTIYVEAGIGEIADGTAGVKYAYAWAQRRGWMRARPVVGAWVSFLRGDGHQGVVTWVSRTFFGTIEGNTSDAVRAHVYRIGQALTVFIAPPCVQGARA